ncbi:MAG: glycosyltransferase family 4 protein [Hahellaceae bacterium]|nr:glycosyltransferase family 4 protein [Hahellaceae bacterium]MCP5210244.1 glycosyltransferase family 4 protein [Hahellaceae bacterium]
MKRTVFLFLDSRGMGGVETHVLTLARSLRQRGDHVVVLFWQRYGAHPMIPELVSEGISFKLLKGKFSHLLQLLYRNPHSVLHTHGYKANILGRMAAALLFRRCVSTFHNGDLGEGKLRLYTWLDLASAFMSKNIAVSQEISQRIFAKNRLIPNYVRLPSLSVAPQRCAIAFVGRLEQVKRADRFIDLARRFPSHEFHVYGEGSQRLSLQSNSPKNVQFRGFVADMAGVWRNIDLMIICSDTEGLPLCALEAMSYEVPVVARPVGDLPVLINDGVNGYIRDSNDELAEGIARWLALTPSQKQVVRQNARQTIGEHFSEERCLSALLTEYC